MTPVSYDTEVNVALLPWKGAIMSTSRAQKQTEPVVFCVPGLQGEFSLSPQECSGNYQFFPPRVVLTCTPGFAQLFNDGAVIPSVMFTSLQSIQETYKKPDYLQVFHYQENEDSRPQKYWVMYSGAADAVSSSTDEEPEAYITFLLPDEY